MVIPLTDSLHIWEKERANVFTSQKERTQTKAPLFLVALLLVRGVPALLYRPLVSGRRTIAAGLLQATSLPFIVTATQIGMTLGLLTKATSAALISAGMGSVLLFPTLALTLMRRSEVVPAPAQQ
jgi:hypothetical protein